LLGAAAIVAVALFTDASLAADDAAELTKDGEAALTSLYAKAPAAKALSAKTLAILVFPKITKAGFGIGGQSGEGVLLKKGKSVAYFRTSGASMGMQIGAQTYGYAMFLMTEKAVASLTQGNGFEVGVGPSVVVMDEGMAKNTTTKTMKDDIYAFIFGQQGLMAGMGIQGNKITKIDKD